MSLAFDLITFDCYGTLIDWEQGIVAALQREAARAGKTLDAGQIIAAYHAQEPAVESEPYRKYREVLEKTARRVAARVGLVIEPERAGFLAESLGGEHPFVEKLLAGRSPAARAAELINSTQLTDPTQRRRLAKGDFGSS